MPSSEIHVLVHSFAHKGTDPLYPVGARGRQSLVLFVELILRFRQILRWSVVVITTNFY